MALAAVGGVLEVLGLNQVSSRFLPEKLCVALPGFDLMVIGGKIVLKHGLSREERAVNPYEEMKKLLESDHLAGEMDELELQELCGFFGFSVGEFNALAGDRIQSFIDGLYKRGHIETDSDYLFSVEALQRVDARRKSFCAVVAESK